jgi:glyoxylase-like metal-dependent hydrolase (beta-lactamase superfamily II)
MPSSGKYILIPIVVGPIETNCYLLTDAVSKKTLIIDPGDEAEKIIKQLENNKFIPIAIINTHGHADHITANGPLKKAYNIPIYISNADSEYLTDPELNYSGPNGVSITSPKADHFVKTGDVIEVGELKVKVIGSPGHTPGGILLMCEDLLFTGDTLFCGDIGRSDLPGGDEEALRKSLKFFRTLPQTLKLYPGHGPSCILSEELKHNPYL